MTLLAAVAAALVLGSASQEQDQAVDLPDIVVNARPRSVEVAREFTRAVTLSPFMAVSIATWQTRLCVHVSNLSPATSAILTSHIEARAQNLGLELGSPGCEPNVIVVATADGARTAADLVRDDGSAFIRSSGPTQLSRDALARFLETDDPVRWWNTSAPFDVRNREVIVPIDGAQAPFRDLGGDVAFGTSGVQALLSATVVIDARKTADIPITALADYIAFVVLAEVDATRDFSAYPSILNLFSGTAVDAMTEWDLRYLNALYLARVRPINPRYQLGEIARLMSAAEAPQARMRTTD